VQQPSQPTEPVQISMSLGEAMDVVWTPNGHFKPIGELLETGAITERDLAWAAFLADRINPRIREAARTTLAHKLRLQTIQTGNIGVGPSVIGGGKYLERMERWSFGEVFFIAGLAFASTVIFAGLLLAEAIKGALTIPVLIFVGVVLIFVARYINSESRRAYKEYEAFKKGREGEDRIAERAVANLDGKWTIFRNFRFPDRRSDIDLLLVGPGGVWALEVKTYGANTKSAQPVPRQRGWRSGPTVATNTPDTQALANAGRLKQVLSQRSSEITWVQAVLVFADYQPVDFTTSSGSLAVWSASEEDDRLVQLRGVTRLSEQQVENVTAALKAMQAPA
jgi:hypothetical protein